jgi:hypothetical protein
VEQDVEQGGAIPAATEETSLEFLGQWQRLVSTTNWEKGRIICQWRQALIDSGAAWQESADEAWSRRVGSVSGQHVGRLRRVYEKFGQQRETYPGLYWSHFQAAIDWPDAEMWLEGAVHSGWSISQMRRQRAEALGGLPTDEPEQAVVDSELDEDFSPAAGELLEVRDPHDAAGNRDGAAYTSGPNHAEGPDFGDAPSGMALDSDDPEAEPWHEPPVAVRPFEQLAELPADVAEAFESFKLAILHHKLAGWTEISCRDLVGALESLKQLALAPSAG